MISGTSALEIAAAACGSNNVVLTSSCSIFGAGLTVDAGSTTLTIGSSSSGSPGDVTSGPVGTGTLTLSSGNTLNTTGSGYFSLGNNISLNSGGTVTLLGGNSSVNLELDGNIDGCSELEIASGGCGGANTVVLTSSNNSFSGGVFVDSGSTTLEIAASSSGSPGDLSSGPLGTGTVTLSSGNTFTVPSSSAYSIGNAIALNDGGTVTLLGGASGAGLELDGMISGSSTLEIASGGGGGANTVTLTSSCSTFCGGIIVDAGNSTLVVGASGSGSAGDISSGPLGTGTLTLGDGTTLTTPMCTPITVLNDIVLGAGGGGSNITLGGASNGLLSLLGTISDYCGPGSLTINGPVEIEGSNTYSGGTTVNSTTLTVDSDTGLGTGGLSASGSTINFTSSSPTIYNLQFCNTTINFASGSSPSIIDLVSDTSGSNNSINLGAGGGTTLTIQVDGDPQYNGTINGNGALSLTSGSYGELEFSGANTYTNGTTVNSGVLAVAENNSAFGTGTVTLASGSALGIATGITITNQISIPNDGAAIGGFGTVAPAAPQAIEIRNGSAITGGHGTLGDNISGFTTPVIGTLTFGPNATIGLGSLGLLQFSMMNAIGSSGTDFSAINVQGTVSLDSTAGLGNQFVIQVVGVDSTGLVSGTANSFDPTQAYSWTLLSAGTITGTFDPNAFAIDASSFFSNSLGGGSFSVSESGNDLLLNFTPVPEPSTWALMACGAGALALAALRRRRIAVLAK